MVANETLVDSLVASFATPGWETNCIYQLGNYTDLNIGLVDGHGQPVSSLTNGTWGISVGTCLQYCNATAIPFNFNFQTFSSSMTNYLLPWLALTAQLPFETGSPWNNMMSFCLAVGSPALITFSLTITILNRYWVRSKFRDLRSTAHGVSVRTKCPEYESRVRAAQYLLQEAQQVPLRASQEKGWLSSLVVVPDNTEWWERLELRLRSTRRDFTPSLVAQMGLALLAYLFTVIASFLAALGDPATALQIASGSLWIWLVPVILGWITVGTQYSHHSIEDALKVEPAAHALDPAAIANTPNAPFTQIREQKGLVVRSGLSPQPHQAQTAAGTFGVPELGRLEIPTWFGAGVSGDEKLKGPIYNYAKLFTWWQLATSVHAALDKVLENVSNDVACEGVFQHNQANQGRPVTPWDDTQGPDNLIGDSRDTSAYCGLDTRQPIHAYPAWSPNPDIPRLRSMPSEVYKRIIAASFAAVFVQWGTTGPSIMMAYLTPTVGLGCRSAGYTFYGGLATFAWLCLLASMLVSHEVMLKYQAVHIRNTSMDFRLPSDANNPNQYNRTWSHATLCGIAVFLRYLGKSIAVLNTAWLIVSSLFEFTGGYDNCWCKGDQFAMGTRGWVVIFKHAKDLAVAAKLPWGGGLAMTLIVCAVSYFFFAIGSVKTDDD